MIKRLYKNFIASQVGATAVEYALLIGLLVLAIVGGVTQVGATTNTNFEAAANAYPDS
ncbi:Flp family type IVb pilin [Henriciella sp.]|uniref:Flp family type IVb pilin n=1 Tax=Henriciella sp. TaxID=1968823 RepID=UPI00260F7225|nr:Flp family type IVb pilin [Henriciella sp.]